jgi:tRNA-modifying protein YgfZ
MDMPWLTSNRDRVTITGRDAASYLHSQLSQDVAAMSDGQTAWTFALQPTGKVEVLARLTRVSEQQFEMDTDAGFGELLVARLNRFKIRVDVAFELHPSPVEAADPAAEVSRLRAVWPKMGAEIVPGETIPSETGVVDQAVSFTKGCYPGQELVERMDSRGAAAPRHLVHLEVGAGAEVGDPVEVDGVVVGELTSVCGGEALARVKRGVLQE